MRLKTSIQTGYTLIELMITVAIVGILAAIAIPTYVNYTNHTKFQTVVQAVSALKPAVTSCIESLNTATGCSGGTNGIPAPTPEAGISSLTVINGVISATGAGGTNQPPADTYILQGTITNGVVNWTPSGSCVTHGTCE